MVLSLLVIQSLSGFWNLDETMTYTFNTIVAGIVASLVVVKVCQPMNWLRRILSTAVVAIFCAGVVLAPEFLGIYSIFRWEMVLLIPLVCMVLVFFKIFTGFAEGCFQVGNRIRKKKEERRERHRAKLEEKKAKKEKLKL
jgi:cation-transporting ATPase E